MDNHNVTFNREAAGAAVKAAQAHQAPRNSQDLHNFQRLRNRRNNTTKTRFQVRSRKRSVRFRRINMEPRARIGKNRGQQNFSDQDLNHFLFAFGDVNQSLDGTRKVFDEIMTDFITEICFESARSAQLAGRQKVKLDDVKFACRKNPAYLGKIEESIDKKAEIDRAKKLVDVNDDKIIKSGVKALEEELGDADDDADTNTVGGKSGAGK
ncbi:hypothetical protein HYFRA_00000985 [Hymenoscyphus fraxineus]|uniref:Transcription initiation factor TFIID subunit 13 n=2 Tax=Hymenoscyphus TaxID=5182 RepID=A0A9N9KU91_9HELO|nr:hypothetical protein HYFRA_00000985 [Hymenoscyphus fraxineus]